MATKDLKIGSYDVYANDLLIDSSTLDLQFVENEDYIKQKILIRLQWFQAEWFLDTNIGLPWFQEILVKSPNIPLINARIRKQILDTPGVISLVSFTGDYDASARSYTVEFEAKISTGALTSGTVTIGA